MKTRSFRKAKSNKVMQIEEKKLELHEEKKLDDIILLFCCQLVAIASIWQESRAQNC